MNPVETYIEDRPSWQRPLLHHLRWLILESHPGVTEAVKWNLPVFALHGKQWIYLSPLKDGVDISFMNGTRMTEYHDLLRIDGRKLVGSYRIGAIDSYDENELSLLLEASGEDMMSFLRERGKIRS